MKNIEKLENTFLFNAQVKEGMLVGVNKNTKT